MRRTARPRWVACRSRTTRRGPARTRRRTECCRCRRTLRRARWTRRTCSTRTQVRRVAAWRARQRADARAAGRRMHSHGGLAARWRRLACALRQRRVRGASAAACVPCRARASFVRWLLTAAACRVQGRAHARTRAALPGLCAPPPRRAALRAALEAVLLNRARPRIRACAHALRSPCGSFADTCRCFCFRSALCLRPPQTTWSWTGWRSAAPRTRTCCCRAPTWRSSSAKAGRRVLCLHALHIHSTHACKHAHAMRISCATRTALRCAAHAGWRA